MAQERNNFIVVAEILDREEMEVYQDTNKPPFWISVEVAIERDEDGHWLSSDSAQDSYNKITAEQIIAAADAHWGVEWERARVLNTFSSRGAVIRGYQEKIN